MSTFDISQKGPVTFAWEEQPVPGYRVQGTAEASGTYIGENAVSRASELARPDYQLGVNHVDGELIVTSATGDELHIHYFGDTPVPNQETGELKEDIGFEIVGGTGQFEGATGSGRLTSQGNINEDPCIVSTRLLGTIEVPALQA